MTYNFLAGIVAAGLLLAYLWPPLFKLRDGALTLVILVGLIMMLVDLWQSLRSKGD